MVSVADTGAAVGGHPLLAVSGLSKSYGGISSAGIDLSVGSILALVTCVMFWMIQSIGIPPYAPLPPW